VLVFEGIVARRMQDGDADLSGMTNVRMVHRAEESHLRRTVWEVMREFQDSGEYPALTGGLCWADQRHPPLENVIVDEASGEPAGWIGLNLPELPLQDLRCRVDFGGNNRRPPE
jgi:hypothetical protein